MLAFGLLSFAPHALTAQETMPGNEPARIRDAARAAVESDPKTGDDVGGKRVGHAAGLQGSLLRILSPVLQGWLRLRERSW